MKLVERHRFDPRNALHRRLLAEEVLPSTAPEDLRELQGNYQRMGHDRTAATHWARQFAEAVRGRRSS